MVLAKALTEICSALGRHSAHDSMAWGCDLDPGNSDAQLSAPAGEMSTQTSHVRVAPARKSASHLKCTTYGHQVTISTACTLSCDGGLRIRSSVQKSL